MNTLLTIPYELLQLIYEQLLPKFACRLASTCKYIRCLLPAETLRTINILRYMHQSLKLISSVIYSTYRRLQYIGDTCRYPCLEGEKSLSIYVGGAIRVYFLSIETLFIYFEHRTCMSNESTLYEIFSSFTQGNTSLFYKFPDKNICLRILRGRKNAYNTIAMS